ncbi:hemolysin family protein [Streptomyces sp. SKN60]|uniref:hemolysin family protein n=1 Tax=Streptomyces TaxID=1883 RepID=UPI002245638C|nr:hemolysin family protein [Streptomyces sp. SKN60]MCX2183990.1 hemolysin family protein [Streptomyces sp. SKN60]
MSLLPLLFAVLLVLANGFFVGAEFALVSVRRSQIEQRSGKRARQVLYGLENLPQMMAAAQFGITVASLTLGAVAEPTVASLLEPVFHAVGVPDGLVHPLGYVIALAAVVFLHLVIGEMVPKNLAMADPERTALALGPGLVGFARLCRPVTSALGACARLVLKAFKVEPKDEVEAVFTSAQLGRLVEDAGQAGLLDPAEQERLEDALELGTRPVTDVLIPSASLVTVPPSVTPREIEELTVRTGFSRFPVRAPGGAAGVGAGVGVGGRGTFMGFVHVKDVLDLEDRERAVPQQVWRPMATLRAELPLDDALTVMRRAATHLAQVSDASGRVLGLVALEDVLETLVGEVRDPAHRVRTVVRHPVGTAGAQPSARVIAS